MTALTTVSYLNPFFLNGRQINNIIFYNDEGILFETHRGWFGCSSNPFNTFEIGDVKVRRITALNKMDKKENFCVSVTASFINDKEYDLYLYVDGKNIVIDNEEIIEEKFSATENRKYVIRNLTIYGQKISLDETLKFIKTDFGKKVEEVDKELSEIGISISHYDLEKLLKHYDLVKK